MKIIYHYKNNFERSSFNANDVFLCSNPTHIWKHEVLLSFSCYPRDNSRSSIPYKWFHSCWHLSHWPGKCPWRKTHNESGIQSCNVFEALQIISSKLHGFNTSLFPNKVEQKSLLTGDIQVEVTCNPEYFNQAKGFLVSMVPNFIICL